MHDGDDEATIKRGRGALLYLDSTEQGGKILTSNEFIYSSKLTFSSGPWRTLHMMKGSKGVW